MILLGFIALALAALPAILAAVNLAALARTPRAAPRPDTLVSILIPARNEAANIGPALDAALASTDVAVEVLVMDDGSTDDTASIVQAMPPAIRACASSPPRRCPRAGPARSTPATASRKPRAARISCSSMRMCA